MSFPTLTLLNIIRTSPSETHTLRVCFFHKECARVISTVSAFGCQNAPQITLAGRFLERILTKKR